jgi:hypothetical protein
VVLSLCTRYVGKVLEWDREEECLTVHYYKGSPMRALDQVCRPWTNRNPEVTVEFDHVFLVVPGLDGAGRLPRAARKKLSHWVRMREEGKMAPVVAFAGTGELEVEDDELDRAPGIGDKRRRDP